MLSSLDSIDSVRMLMQQQTWCRLLVLQLTQPYRNMLKFQVDVINPLTTEFFPPRQHIFMHSAHTNFVGTPLPQHPLLSGQTWWGPHTWRDPSGNTINDIHDPHKLSNRRSKVDVSRIFTQHFTKLGPDLTDGTPYTTNLHVFLRPWVGSMNIIRIKNPRVNESH